MPSHGSKPPPAAFFEEFDEDNKIILPNSRTSANVARKRPQSLDLDTKPPHDRKSHDGSDSGYSSTAGTTGTVTFGPPYANATDLHVNTSMDRERQPYSHVLPSRSAPVHQGPNNIQEPYREENTRVQDFRHPQGTCQHCDYYGYHPQPPPHVPQVHRESSKKSKDGNPARPQQRRPSSKHESRPEFVAYPAQSTQYGTHPQFEGGHPGMPAYVWSGPVTPSSPAQGPYSPYSLPVPDTPSSMSPSAYCACCVAQPDSHQISYHQSGYVNSSGPQLIYANYPQPPTLSEDSYNPGPKISNHRSSKSIEDRKLMPPPSTVPRMETTLPHRPATKRSPTEPAARRPSEHKGDNERPELKSKRLSRDSTSFAPTTRKPEGHKRPAAHKSVSYPDGHRIMSPAVSVPRRNTDSNDSIRRKEHAAREDAAEAHIQQTSGGMTNPITAETVKRHTSRNVASETGTRRTGQSKESYRSHRASTVGSESTTTITMPAGLSLNIPQDFEGKASLRINDTTISISTNDTSRSREDGRQERRQIERAPSDYSQNRGTTVSSARETNSLTRETSRRSQPENPKYASANPSKRSGRAASDTTTNEYYRRREPEAARAESYYSDM